MNTKFVPSYTIVFIVDKYKLSFEILSKTEKFKKYLFTWGLTSHPSIYFTWGLHHKVPRTTAQSGTPNCLTNPNLAILYHMFLLVLAILNFLKAAQSLIYKVLSPLHTNGTIPATKISIFRVHRPISALNDIWRWPSAT